MLKYIWKMVNWLKVQTSYSDTNSANQDTGYMKLLYIASSSFSGSTLLSFLLNTHKDMFCAGEMIGWEYDDTPFYCSCGATLETCPFYQYIGKIFRDNGLPFAFSHFGTAYQLSRNERINNLLTRNFPKIQNSTLEKLRDKVVRHTPILSTKMQQFGRANALFMSTALKHSGTHIFVDASKDAFRLRHLQQINDLDINILHLVRDLRGVILSFRKNRGIEDMALATRLWIQDQVNILRIAEEFPSVLKVYYENICNDTEGSLAMISRFMDLSPMSFSGDFKSASHHILGNSMRLDGTSKIVNSERWKKELSDREIETIQQEAKKQLTRRNDPKLTEIIEQYIEH